MSTIETSFGRLRPALARERSVIAVEQQGHGHTPDRDRPLSYRQMADDTASFLEALNVEDADLFGYSMGAGIAVELAIRHRHLVRSMILASPAFSPDGFYPGVLDQDDAGSVDALADSIFHRAYLGSAARSDDWEKLIAKCNQLDRTFEGWPRELVGPIGKPTLILVADQDIITPEHAVEMFKTDYDLAHAAARMRETNAPFAQAFIEMLLTPPSRE